MRRPGLIETGSVLVALYLAKTPAAMGIRSLTDGAYLTAGIYLFAAVLVALIPPLLVRRFPGTRRIVYSALSSAFGGLRRRLRGLLP